MWFSFWISLSSRTPSEKTPYHTAGAWLQCNDLRMRGGRKGRQEHQYREKGKWTRATISITMDFLLWKFGTCCSKMCRYINMVSFTTVPAALSLLIFPKMLCRTLATFESVGTREADRNPRTSRCRCPSASWRPIFCHSRWMRTK